MQFYEGDLALKKWNDGFGKHGDSLPIVLSLMDGDHAVFKMDVVNAQAEAFKGSQSGAVQEAAHEPIDSVQVTKDVSNLTSTEDHRQVSW